VTGDDPKNINNTTLLLDQKFKLKNLDELTYFLGFEIARNSTCMNLSRRKYTFDLLTETDMLNSSPVSTPMNFSTKFRADKDPLDDPVAYHRLIASSFTLLILGQTLHML